MPDKIERLTPPSPSIKPIGPCDECGEPSVRWFGLTAVRICNAPTCWDRQSEKYRSGQREADEMERLADER
jgi:hypothetical protein